MPQKKLQLIIDERMTQSEEKDERGNLSIVRKVNNGQL